MSEEKVNKLNLAAITACKVAAEALQELGTAAYEAARTDNTDVYTVVYYGGLASAAKLGRGVVIEILKRLENPQ